jgi:hypothetical protein
MALEKGLMVEQRFLNDMPKHMPKVEVSAKYKFIKDS